MAEEITRETFLTEWAKAKSVLTEYMENKSTLLDTMALDKKNLGVIYQNAYNAFKVENYLQAENLFLSLFLLDHTDYDFQVGLAAAYEAQEKFENALSIYTLAMMTTGKDPELLFRAAKCLLAMGEKNEARVMFELASQFKPALAKNGLAKLASIEKSKNILKLLNE